MRRKFIKILFGASLAFTIVTIVYLVFFDGFKDVTDGRVHREAFDLFADTEGIYEARIYLIMGEGKSDGTFPIRPYDREEPTYGSVTLTGEKLKDFLHVWEYQEVSWGRQAMCHDPAYGFRLFRRGKLTRETSICWSCNNFYVTPYPGMSTWYGFNADSKQAKELLAFCNKLLPYRK
jgi:hypothetical protein